jgi:hypothetical protein
MGRTYLFDHARFSWTDNSSRTEAVQPLRSRDGRIIGLRAPAFREVRGDERDPLGFWVNRDHPRTSP